MRTLTGAMLIGLLFPVIGLGMLVDLSHCGQRTTADGIAASSAPVSITHSGCNAVARHPRSKDDAELRAMADGGGS